MTISFGSDYKLIDDKISNPSGIPIGIKRPSPPCRYGRIRLALCIFLPLCLTTIVIALFSWQSDHNKSIKQSKQLTAIPNLLHRRLKYYANYLPSSEAYLHDFRLYKNQTQPTRLNNKFSTLVNETLSDGIKKIVCYYVLVEASKTYENLQITNVDANLCTHINIGIVNIVNNSLQLTDDLIKVLKQTEILRKQNGNLKILLWAGGAESDEFNEVVRNHANRKMFIKSVKYVLQTYKLDGIDIDWEFPSAYNRERMHFTQLLMEIRREYQREKKNYLLTVAAAAPEGIAFYAYDIKKLNEYVDFVNIMTYDFHFYSRGTPFTGLNSPLYPRNNERSILATFNINYTINYWNTNGLQKEKIVIGLPTYGHSFKLVNPFNNGIGSPASGYGSTGSLGFVSYSEVCWFKQNNIFVNTVYDEQTCSPYLYSGTEWISFENEQSLECKTNFINDNNFGGAMIFALNTDDFGFICSSGGDKNGVNMKPQTFPLIRKIRSILFDEY